MYANVPNVATYNSIFYWNSTYLLHWSDCSSTFKYFVVLDVDFIVLDSNASNKKVFTATIKSINRLSSGI